MDVGWAWREERPLAFALVAMETSICLEPPILLWRKQPPKNATQFLLDAKRSKPIYPLSELGRAYSHILNEAQFPLQYTITVDQCIQVPAKYEVFSALCAEGWLSLWQPAAPLRYFAGRAQATLILVRVGRLSKEVAVQVLDGERRGGNFYSRLDQLVTVAKMHMVVPAERYQERCTALFGFLCKHEWLLSNETVSRLAEEESLF